MAGRSRQPRNSEGKLARRIRKLALTAKAGTIGEQVRGPCSIRNRSTNLVPARGIQLQIDLQRALVAARNSRQRRAGGIKASVERIILAADRNLRSEALRRSRRRAEITRARGVDAVALVEQTSIARGREHRTVAAAAGRRREAELGQRHNIAAAATAGTA